MQLVRVGGEQATDSKPFRPAPDKQELDKKNRAVVKPISRQAPVSTILLCAHAEHHSKNLD